MMAKYARINEDLTVRGWMEIDDPSIIAPHKKWSDGGLHVRPVEEGAIPSFRAELAKLNTVISVLVDKVVITHTVLPHGVEVQKQAVKNEARRRILAAFPDWKQLNMTARAVELQDIWRTNGSWTDAETAEADAINNAWAWVKLMRQRSDEIEALDPIPNDFDSNVRWAVTGAS